MNTDTRDRLAEARKKALDIAMVILAGVQNATPEDLNRAVDLALNTTSALYPEVKLDQREFRRNVEANVSIFVGRASALGDDHGHTPWLNQRRGEIDWRFWEAYRRNLITSGIAPEVVGRLDDITDDILGRLEWPRREGAWDRRGMVVGQVQSGKTSNYIGLVTKAADAGYKVIVVLAGMHNSLRSQTQRRFDEGFLGLDSRTVEGRTGEERAIGVGAGGVSHPAALSLTSSEQKGDFSKSIADRIAARIDRDHPPVLLVVKKNATILRNLIRWLTTLHERAHPESGRMVVPDLPLLVIDDEADHASVNTKDVELEVDETGKVVDETDPAKINGLIRTLLYSFEQSAYIGYTATPFANIFIYQEQPSPTYGEDLFPRSFILRIPPPSNYVGPAQVFGLGSSNEAEAEAPRGLPIVRPVEDSEDWIPARHKKELVPGSMPDSLRDALRSFMISCATRAARGQRNVHNSMLVHVTRFVAVQGHVTEQVRHEVDRMKNQLRYGDGEGAPALWEALRELWETDYIPTHRSIPEPECGETVTWERVAAELPTAAARVEILEVNGGAGDALTYTDREDGVSVIAIGGDKLSRGLTLEGLTISYYLRASKMYDTLMQMGRWFGYRPGYTDLCRLYTTPELQLAYRNITLASEELLDKFDEMAATGDTPERFALYVRTSPDGLMVTAPAKMRHGAKLDLTFSGNIVETIVFPRVEQQQTGNLHLVNEFLREQEGEGRRIETRSHNYRWDDVPGADVAVLLRGWRTADRAQKARGSVLADYIKSRNGHDELTHWMVVLVNRDGATTSAEIAGLTVGLTERNPPIDVTPPPDTFVIRRLVNPPDERMDIDPEQIAQALARTQSRWDAGKSRAKERPTEPSGSSIRAIRPPRRGLLLLYPMTAGQIELEGFAGPLMGFAVSFPDSPGAPTISYMVPARYWEMDFGSQLELGI